MCHFYQQEFLRIWPTVQCSVVCTVTVSECGGGEGVWLQSVKTSPDSPYTALTAGDRRHRFHLKPQYLFLSAAKIALFTPGHSDSVITDNRPTTHTTTFKKLLFLLKLCETVSPVHECAWQIGVSLDIIYSVHVHILEIPFLVSAAATLYSPRQQPAAGLSSK